jgi:hypothetical protein
MDVRILKLLEPLLRRPGADEAAIERLRQYVGCELPSDYLHFLRWSNGGEGPLRLTGLLDEKRVSGTRTCAA